MEEAFGRLGALCLRSHCLQRAPFAFAFFKGSDGPEWCVIAAVLFNFARGTGFQPVENTAKMAVPLSTATDERNADNAFSTVSIYSRKADKAADTAFNGSNGILHKLAHAAFIEIGESYERRHAAKDKR